MIGAAGQYYDPETDLFENWHRYYDANTGRYLEPDPIWKYPERLLPRLESGHFDPVYAYGGNNPITGMDPTGEVGATVTAGASVGLGLGLGFELEAGIGLYGTYDENSGDVSLGLVATGGMAANPLPGPTDPSSNLVCGPGLPEPAGGTGMENTLTFGGFAGAGGTVQVSSASTPKQLGAKSEAVVIAPLLPVSLELSPTSASVSLGKSEGLGVAAINSGAITKEVVGFNVSRVQQGIHQAWAAVKHAFTAGR